MKAIPIKNGILHVCENNAICPYCEQKVPNEWQDLYDEQNEIIIRKKCKYCKRFIGITSDIHGDLVAFDLKPIKTN